MGPVAHEARVASRTDRGRVRSSNEDACAESTPRPGERLLVVADGMGGHRGGEVASRMAVERVGRTFADAPQDHSVDDRLRAAIESANRAIFAQSESDPALGGMGTTVVALHLGAGPTATVAHVGDSRAYRLREGRLEALTRDHSVVAELVRDGALSEEDAALHPRRNEILRSVGIASTVMVDVRSVDARPGDRFLLCSDGLCGVVADAAIQNELLAPEAEAAADALIAAANAAGGPDNVTVQVVDVPGSSTPGEASARSGTAAPPEAEPSRDDARRRGRRIGALLLVAAVGATAWLIWQSTQTPVP